MKINSEHVALVTGGSSGLGAAAVRSLHAAGANVVLVDLPESLGGSAADELAPRVECVAADVTDEGGIEQAVARAAEIGELRVIVNCAGVGTAARVLGEGKPHDLGLFQKVINTNLIGTFNVLRLAASAMADLKPVDGERGVIINTASISAFDGQLGQIAYSASKAGVVGMTLPAARDLAQHLIRVLAIAPGGFDTPLFAKMPAEGRESLLSDIPHPHRLGKPSEYGLLVTQLVALPYLNGEVIRLDGALRMNHR